MLKNYEFVINKTGQTAVRVRAENLKEAQEMACADASEPIKNIAYWRILPTPAQIKKTKSLMRGL